MGFNNCTEGIVTYGPWGGKDGKEWVYIPRGSVKKITVHFDRKSDLEAVDSITFHSYCSNGEIESSTFGGKGGNQTVTIFINYPDEYLVSISGTIGCHFGSMVVTSICFKTSEKVFGPYGFRRGISFTCDSKDGVIVGFHGREDKYLTAIGVFVMPKSVDLGQNSACAGKHELCSSVPRMEVPRDAGPWGASGGNPWDDGIFATVSKVWIKLGEVNAICAIRFGYLKKNGELDWSRIHAGSGGSLEKQVEFDVNDGEYLIGISGYYGPVEGYNGLEAIASITFHTNKTQHGPYGKERCAGHVYYSSSASPGKVVGFHGRDNGFISAIGVHMEYF